MLWDCLLYVPTVIALCSIGLKLWFSPNQSWAYILFFMGSFFFFVGANRILSGRLMLLPASPVSLELSKQQLSLEQRNGERIDLVKNVRYYPDYAGKSFGISGMDVSGKKRQFVFYRGQFIDDGIYQDLQSRLGIYR